MTRNPSAKWLATAVALLGALAACKGDTGATGPQGQQGSSASTTPATRLYAQITAVKIPNGGSTGGVPSLTYKLFSDAALTQQVTACAGGGTSGYAAFSPNFTIAKQVDDATAPGTKRWQSYLNKVLNGVTVATIEGAHDTVAGTLKDNGDGTCTYTFQADLSKKVAPGSAVAVTESFDPAAVTRFGMQNNPSETDATHPAFDGYGDVIPSSGAIQTADSRMLVTQAACNACHDQVAHHGAKRLSIGYCVTCHNGGTPDPDPTSVGSTSLDLAVMIHKIHQGDSLPSVTGKDIKPGAPAVQKAGKIVINGTDYTGVAFPQDTGNCNVCHNAQSGTGADYWKTQLSIEACTGCHDRTSFADVVPAGFNQHGGGSLADGTCAQCHAPGAQYGVDVVHKLVATTTATQAATFKLLSVTNTGVGGLPVVQFAVTDSTGANVDLASSTMFKGGSARITIDLGWSSNKAGALGPDWTNTASGATSNAGTTASPNYIPAPGQPATLDVMAGLAAATPTVTKNGDGTYTATFPATPPAGSTFTGIPSAAQGSGVAVLEGRMNSTLPNFTAIRSDTMPFAITDASPVARRDVVDIAKCDKCHGQLSLHGNNRVNNIQTCVVCHNSEATDATQRTVTDPTDGKMEESIQFATMIHSIHAGKDQYTPGIIVYGFAKTPTNFYDVVLPEGNSVGKCYICHADTNPMPSAVTGILNGVTQQTETALLSPSADQSTYYRRSSTTAVCSSCHATSTAKSHMEQNGGQFHILQADLDAATGTAGAETCFVCHGPGAQFDPAKFHGH